MMEKLIKDNLPLFENFQNDNWNSIVNAKHMEQILQEVVDKIANHIGLKETPCKIKIKSMKNPTSKGLFNPKTKTIYLESDLFIKKLMYLIIILISEFMVVLMVCCMTINMINLHY